MQHPIQVMGDTPSSASGLVTSISNEETVGGGSKSMIQPAHSAEGSSEPTLQNSSLDSCETQAKSLLACTVKTQDDFFRKMEKQKEAKGNRKRG